MNPDFYLASGKLQNTFLKIDVFKRDGRRIPNQAEKRVTQSEYSHRLSFLMAHTKLDAICSGVWINLCGILPRSIFEALMNDVIVNPG